MLDKKKILVTGAAGFIGFHLVRKLVEEEFSVVALDNINDYYDTKLKEARLRELGVVTSNIENKKRQTSEARNFSFYKLDITDYESLIELFKIEKFDVVVNLAAQAGVRYSLENPHTYIQSNVVGFLNVLECCRIFNIQHLVYASSSSVYGNNRKIPFSEKDRVDHPVSLYAASKKSNELMAHVYSHLYQLPTTGLRFFTVYGPWGRPDMSPIIFAKAIRDGDKIKIFNNGDMQRDFTFIDDIVEGICGVLMNSPDKTITPPYFNLYNIGNSAPIHLMDFISLLEKAMRKTAIKEFYPMQKGDVYQTYADTNHLYRDTGYKPKIDLSEGIKLFVDWFKNQTVL